MPRVKHIAAVWVPFEIFANGREIKCDDLPRFALPEDVKSYLQIHGQALSKRRLQWREHFEKDFVDEFLHGIGSMHRGKLH